MSPQISWWRLAAGLTAMRSSLPHPPQQLVPYWSSQSVLALHSENSLLPRSTAAQCPLLQRATNLASAVGMPGGGAGHGPQATGPAQVALRASSSCRMLTAVYSLIDFGMQVQHLSNTSTQSRPEHAAQSSLPVPSASAAASPAARPLVPPLPGVVCDVDSLPPHAEGITSPLPATTTPTNPQRQNSLAALAAWRFTLSPLLRVGARPLTRSRLRSRRARRRLCRGTS